MNGASVACPRCYVGLPAEALNTPDLARCPACQSPVQAAVFPALFQPLAAGQTGEQILIEGESACFYHPRKKAVIPCDSCGRFLCALCDVELRSQHLCPACLESGKQKGKLEHLQDHRVLYDEIALALAVYPLILFLFWFITIITAPMALYLSIRYWNAPSSLIPRTKTRFVVAIVLASLQLVGWAFFIFFLLTAAK